MGKRRSVQNPFGIELPEKIEEQMLSTLVAWHRHGMSTQEERDLIFMGHVRLGISIAGEFGWRARHLINDLVSVAMLGIAEAIYHAPDKMHDNNITPYIGTRIRGSVADFIQQQHIVASRTLRRRLAENPMWVQPLFDSLTKAHDRASIVGNSIIETLDYIQYCIDIDVNTHRREYKRAVIQLRSSGYTNKEIAGILEISDSHVYTLLTAVQHEFEKECPFTFKKTFVLAKVETI